MKINTIIPALIAVVTILLNASCVSAAELEFTVSKSRIGIGDSVTLTWKSDETSCIASGGWEGSKEANGSTTLYPVATATYLLECGTVNPAKKSKKITAVPKPDIRVWADKTVSESRSRVVISWEAVNATSCTFLKGSSYVSAVELKGSKIVNPYIRTVKDHDPTTTAIYTVRCHNGSGVASTADITIQLTPEARIKLSASKHTITKGQSLTLTWSAQGVPACQAEGMWEGMKEFSGTQVVTPVQTGVYLLTCARKSASVNVVVNEKPTSTQLQPQLSQQQQPSLQLQPDMPPPPPVQPFFTNGPSGMQPPFGMFPQQTLPTAQPVMVAQKKAPQSVKKKHEKKPAAAKNKKKTVAKKKQPIQKNQKQASKKQTKKAFKK